MSRLEAWLSHLSTLVVSLTGFIYAYMNYVMKPQDPFSVVNHPWQPTIMEIHILAAPVFVLLLGIMVHSHILLKLQNGGKTARKSGLLLIPLFVLMTASGYLLQVVPSWRKILVVVHLISGFLWFTFYVTHQVASIRLRRTIAQQRSFSQAGI